MQYPGNPELSAEAQDRVLTTFKQAIQKLHAGAREESMIALEFVLRLDPQFGPARQLHEQLTSGAEEVDLSAIVGQLQESTDTKVDQLLVDAVDDYNERRFHQAREKVQQVLKELPGHKEARDLLAQIEESLKTEAQVGQYLVQAREALDRGEAEESANFVMMAQALDPHHPGISPILADLEAMGAFVHPEPAAPEEPEEEPPVTFETTDLGSVPPVDWEAAEPAEPAAQGFDDLLGQPAPADAGWSFEEPAAPAGEPGPAPEEPVPGPEQQEAFPGGSGVDDLFDAGDDNFFEPVAAAAPAEAGEQFQNLLIAGRNAFDVGDYRTAIDRWSRIFLTDPENSEARRLIEDARRQKEDHDRPVEQLLSRAEEAIGSGRTDEARELLAQVAQLDPGNIHALELEGSMTQGGGQPGPASIVQEEPSAPVNTLGDLDIDLFDEAAPAADTASTDQAVEPSLDLENMVNTMDEGVVQLPDARRKPKLSVRTLAFVGVGILVVALGAWFGARMLAGHRQAASEKTIERALREADTLYRQGHAKDAVRLLETLHVSGPDKVRVDHRLKRYRKALLPPTPTPPPEEAVKAEKLFDEGRLLGAYQEVQAGLEKNSSDPGLQELRKTILAQESDIGPLSKALDDGDYLTALGICQNLETKYPDNAEYRELEKKCLFNQAISELRKYNLTEADGHLAALQKVEPDDPEIERIRRFIAKYKTRPADMQLKIFIASLSYR